MEKRIFRFMIGIITIPVMIQACNSKSTTTTPVTPDADNAGLTLQPGFAALAVARDLGKARHIAVTNKGDIYVKLAKLENGKGIYYLHDNDGDGKADLVEGFGDYIGTGIAIKDNYLYATSNSSIYRYPLNEQQKVVNTGAPEAIVTGLIDRGQHNSKSITLDNNNNIYVNIGAYSNACQMQDRTPGSMGMIPCPILDSAGGIWKFKSSLPNQTYASGQRYATGLRNVVGLDWNAATNSLFVMQHGRDQLNTMFPGLYTDQQNADLPAECMYELQQGVDCGWPYIYYDPFKKKKMLSPEYGGNGTIEGGTSVLDPAYTFPAHLAPNALLFYTGNMFPSKYKNGAFIAFHGSWNREPLPQEGCYVVFLPFSNGKPNGSWEIFANNFAGPSFTDPETAPHRPCGLAQGPDGSLYVSDDVNGTIYRIIYKGQ